MQSIQAIRCPNCGKPAERYYLFTHQLTRTQCSACDYLMVTCSLTGNVLEAYAPGIPVARR
jgi:ribosomal protein S27E